MSLELAESDRWKTRSNRWAALLRGGEWRDVADRLKRRGIAGSSAYLVQQIRYSVAIRAGRDWDARYGVDTGGQIELATLDVLGEHKSQGAPAVSTSPKTFRFLSRHFPFDRSRTTYVDVGAGKGRTLLMASELGFGQIVGVEFSRELCGIARKNVTAFRASTRTAAPIDVLHADAFAYEFPTTDLVLYFGNPFALELWPAMIARLAESYRSSPRAITIVVAGSQPQTIGGARDLLAREGAFANLAKGRAPYFFDTYLPYHYACFATHEATRG